MEFKELSLIPNILRALEYENYETPTPIQEQAIPIILEGKDLIGCAQTGTGKTAAFAIPTIQLLEEDKQAVEGKKKTIKALVITPTRELAIQIYDSFRTYGRYTRLKTSVIFGGVSQKPQEEELRQGVDILVATPGRLLDLMKQNHVDISKIKILILDEADRMLDMGFIHDVKQVITQAPKNKQTLLFSATMPPEIEKLSNSLLKEPLKVEVTPASSTVDTITQYLYYVDKKNKRYLLSHILEDDKIESVLVFSRTKHGADRIAKQLQKEDITAQAIHGDKSQGARQSALNDFKNRRLRVLVATDIAARGIDIDELSHVINFDLPDTPETYVHRIGRTGRAGLNGVSISFCDFDEKENLADIENLINKQLNVVDGHPYPLLQDYPSEKKTVQRAVKTKRNDNPSSNSKAKEDGRSRSKGKTSEIDQVIFREISSSIGRNDKSKSVSNSKSRDRAKSNDRNQSEDREKSYGRGRSDDGDRSAGRKNQEDRRKSSNGSSTENNRKSYDRTNAKEWVKSKASSAGTDQTQPKNGAAKKKFRMAADGTLKQKKTFNDFTKVRRKGK